jgi:hypothetical protein
MASNLHFRRACFLIALSLAACAGGEPRFPLREPMSRDTDQRPVKVACEPRESDDDPNHVACAPEPYVSPLVWDAVDNSVFRPLARVFAVDPAGPAPNVNALDEVPDSAWFTNRIGAKKPTREALLRGACEASQMLDGESAAPGSWTIDKGKPNGASPGFRIRVGKSKFMLKTDIKEQPERPSAASAIGAAIYHAVGFNTSCEQIVYFDPKVFTLKPGLTVTDNSGVEKPFDEAALAKVLEQATPRGGLLRMQASAWLPGYLLGPFRYEGTRGDDPNDVIPHEDRRDLRGARLVAAWLNHFDAREQNTMDSWIAQNSDVSDSSPGYIRHYYLDTSDSFGSEWAWDGISRRLGRSYLLDFGDIGRDFVTFGTAKRPWETARRTKGFESFGYYHYRDFDPEAWKNEYPNPAFSRATEHDNAWMARILSRFDRADVEALVTLGKFSRPEERAFLTEVLEQRLRRIVDRYLFRLSPIADVRTEGTARVCATDLARRRAARPDGAFRYLATAHRPSGARGLRVETAAGGKLCFTLPHEVAASAENDDVSRYLVVAVANGAARYPALVHLYDLGAERGYRVVGLERPDSSEVDPSDWGFSER